MTEALLIDDGLPADGPGTDNVSLALESRVQKHIDRDNLEWLSAGMGDEENPSPSVEIDDGEIPVTDQSPEPLWKRGVKDVAHGIVEAPRQAVGGAMDAISAAANLFESAIPFGGIQVFDEDGNLDISHVPQAELDKLQEEGRTAFEALKPAEAESGTGSVIRSAAQFIGPFAVANKALAARGVFESAGRAAPMLRAMTAGAGADFLAFEGQEERLSNLIQSAPALQNPVTEYLAADEDDGELEGRLKNAVEGIGFGALTDSVFAGIRAMRVLRNAKAEKNVANRAAEAFRTAPDDETFRGAAEFSMLGDTSEDAPLLVRQKKAMDSLEETATGVPDDVTARALTNGATPLGEGSETYVNWAKINTPDDIKQIIDDTATGFAQSTKKGQRGVRTNVQTTLSADKIDAWETLSARRTGEPLNAEQTLAARQLWATSADKLGEVAKAAADNATAENLYQFRRMLATHHAVQKEVIAARTETARALQIWNVPVGGSTERLRDIEQALSMTGGADLSLEMAERIAAISRHPNAAQVIGDFTEKSIYAKSRNAVQEYWINALLSGPKTHVVNAVSNAAVIGLSVVERKVAAGLNRAIGIEQGVEVGEAFAQTHGLVSGFTDALRNAGKTARTGASGYGLNKIEVGRTRSISSSAWNLRSSSWAGRAVDTLGTVTNVPGRALQTSDEFFKTLGYRMELHAQAYRQAMREVDAGTLSKTEFKGRLADIIADPPESIRLESASTAAYQTFTNEAGPFVKGLSKILHRYPGGRFILPFMNTPANILTYTFERTPLAPLTLRYRNAIAEGGAKADLALARMATGTGITMFAIDMGMRGQATGSGPSSRTERQNWRRQGFQPYSVKIGDKWVAFNRLDPLGYLVGIGADIAEFVNNSDGDEEMAAELEEAIAATVFSVAENVTSKSYMQGISNLIEAVNDPQRFGPSYVERFAGSFVPTGVAEIARFQDPTMRVSHDIITSMKRRLPGFSDELPARRDLWGRTISYESGLGKTYDAVSPLYVSSGIGRQEPIDEAMARDGWFAGMPSKSLTVDGERIGLRNRPEIYARYLELQGGTKPEEFEAYGVADKYGNKTLLEALNDVVTGKSYLSEEYEEAVDPEDKRSIAMKVVRSYRRAARKQILAEFPELLDVARRKREVRVGESEQ